MRVASIAVVVCLSALASYAAQSARTSTGVVFGKVTNFAGGPLGGATVKLTGGRIPTRTTTADTAGEFRFADVPFGAYVLEVSLSGLVTSKRPVLVSADAPQSSPVIVTLVAAPFRGQKGFDAECRSRRSTAGDRRRRRHTRWHHRRRRGRSAVGAAASKCANTGWRNIAGGLAGDATPFNTEAYHRIEDNGFRSVRADPLSTFL